MRSEMVSVVCEFCLPCFDYDVKRDLAEATMVATAAAISSALRRRI